LLELNLVLHGNMLLIPRKVREIVLDFYATDDPLQPTM
jgi:hypothetical protein